ncbi:SDR family oxidoreductase [Filibacter tadaridae]|uniref:3-oxoacyl-[acyl-carrier-protein] reductase FabG n=1 Tax=Filibacter tadaridae TaxID=2483811 RepID=A0A3P5XFQ1_9BACL|nr:SDR family oxidoreductase [Filibacter tadaridae]VDC29689.1 3-oxoacyl-[acyl-carrier-protein] reductase FabG [Filibacter tadaridae]
MTDRGYCVVLGASGGIGEAIARHLGANGWSLYIHYNANLANALRLQKELQVMYPQSDFKLVQADFSVIDGAEILAKQVRHVGAIVIANGQSMLKLLTDTSLTDMDALWKVHVQNPAHFISIVSSQLRRFKKSYVVFIGSIWGSTGAAGEVMYSTVKGAQHAFVKAYAKEAAYSGVRVNAIAPGWIETRMNSEISIEDQKMVIDAIPLMSTGTPAHIADAVSFLLSGQADYMTGEVMNINGGWYI